MSKQITYSRLTRLLQELGFNVVKSPGGIHMVFKYPKGNAMIVLPNRPSREQVSRLHLAAVERILSESGILRRDEFEGLIKR